jgi:hypothetical protein
MKFLSMLLQELSLLMVVATLLLLLLGIGMMGKRGIASRSCVENPAFSIESWLIGKDNILGCVVGRLLKLLLNMLRFFWFRFLPKGWYKVLCRGLV